MRIVRDPQTAEDLAQETFLRAHKAVESGRVEHIEVFSTRRPAILRWTICGAAKPGRAPKCRDWKSICLLEARLISPQSNRL
ncbi:sigma factor [Rhizobium sp. RU35A]|uniref:sigma factor n=1 Tax=Rhizobium sp. RU35A TaxID=1907414 RepID=UPI001FCE8BD2|nr:sigma factor [Rhizobium sp. RU35A]